MLIVEFSYLASSLMRNMPSVGNTLKYINHPNNLLKVCKFL